MSRFLFLPKVTDSSSSSTSSRSDNDEEGLSKEEERGESEDLVGVPLQDTHVDSSCD